MTIDEFFEFIHERLTLKLGNEFVVKRVRTFKNNGIKRNGISIFKTNVNMAPTIYLDEYFEQYTLGRAISAIVDDILKIYENVKVETNFDTAFFKTYETASKQLAFKLVNTDANAEFLETVPHRNMLNLSIVYMYVLPEDGMQNASIVITNEHADYWGIDEQRLYEDAVRNTPKILPANLRDIADVIGENFGYDGIELQRGHMLVLSNCRNYAGAACILYKDLLKQVACCLGGGFVVLPSSVHEVIIVPNVLAEDMKGLAEIVKGVNETQVGAEEVLSNTPYRYVPELDRLSII